MSSILPVLVHSPKCYQPSLIKFLLCYFYLPDYPYDSLAVSYLGMWWTVTLSFSHITPIYLYSLSKEIMCLLIWGSMVGSFHGGSSVTPPLWATTLWSPLLLRMDWPGDLLLTKRIQQRWWNVPSVIDLYKTVSPVLLDSCSTKGEYPMSKI